MTATLTFAGRFGQHSVNQVASRTAEQESLIEPESPLPKASAGTLTTRTDNDTGVVTLTAGHGLQIGDKVVVKWASVGYRYNMDVTGVDGTAVTLDGGSGASLPSLNSPVVVGKQVILDIADILESSIETLCVHFPRDGYCQLVDSSSVARQTLRNPRGYNVLYGKGWMWLWQREAKGDYKTGPLTGTGAAKTLASIRVTNLDVNYTQTPTIALQVQA